MQINQPQMHTTGQENREIKSQAAAMDATDGGGGSSAAASVMTLEQKIAAMEKDVKERLQAVEAAQREGAALKEELARSREVRLTLLKKWHEARIAYDEVQLQLLEAQGRIDTATRELNDAQRLQLPPHPPSPSSSAHPAGAGDGGAEGPHTALQEELRHTHALVLQSEVQARVLKRFNKKLEEAATRMQERERQERAALNALHQEALQGRSDGVEREMERLHKELVAYRGQIAKVQAAKEAGQRETEAQRRELEELKAKTGDMARRLQEEETTYMKHHAAASPAPLLPAAASSFSTPADTDGEDEAYGYGLSLACDA